MICGMATKKLALGFRSVRDIITVAIGTLGLLYETVLVDETRPTLIAVFVGLIGYPLIAREAGKEDDAQG